MADNPPRKGQISCLALAEKIKQIFYGPDLHTQLGCSSDKYMFLTKVAPFKSEINRQSNSTRFTTKKHWYSKKKRS